MKPETLRYAVVVVVGYGLDFLVALLALRWLSFSLPAAAAAGFLCAFALNYMLHEFWTFRRETSAFSVARLFQAFGAALFALAVRIAFLALIEPYVTTEGTQYVMLLVAAGLSFVANFLLLRTAVFR